MPHILTLYALFRDALHQQYNDLPDAVLRQLSSDLRNALLIIEGTLELRQEQTRRDVAARRLWRQREGVGL